MASARVSGIGLKQSCLHDVNVDLAEKQSRLRLLASHRNGTTRVVTFRVSPDTKQWEVASPEADGKGHDEDRLYGTEKASPNDPIISTVLDARTGDECLATPSALRKADANDPANVTTTKNDKTDLTHCFWIVGGAKEARCFENVTGKQVGYVEWASKGKSLSLGAIQTARVISRTGM